MQYRFTVKYPKQTRSFGFILKGFGLSPCRFWSKSKIFLAASLGLKEQVMIGSMTAWIKDRTFPQHRRIEFQHSFVGILFIHSHFVPFDKKLYGSSRRIASAVHIKLTLDLYAIISAWSFINATSFTANPVNKFIRIMTTKNKNERKNK